MRIFASHDGNAMRTLSRLISQTQSHNNVGTIMSIVAEPEPPILAEDGVAQPLLVDTTENEFNLCHHF